MQTATIEMATTPFNLQKLTLEVSSKVHPGLLFKKTANTWVLSASSYTAPMYKAKPFQEVQHMVKADVWKTSGEISLEFM